MAQSSLPVEPGPAGEDVARHCALACTYAVVRIQAGAEVDAHDLYNHLLDGAEKKVSLGRVCDVLKAYDVQTQTVQGMSIESLRLAERNPDLLVMPLLEVRPNDGKPAGGLNHMVLFLRSTANGDVLVMENSELRTLKTDDFAAAWPGGYALLAARSQGALSRFLTHVSSLQFSMQWMPRIVIGVFVILLVICVHGRIPRMIYGFIRSAWSALTKNQPAG